MAVVALLAQLVIGFIFFNMENERAGLRVSKISRILHYENEALIEKRFFFEVSPLGSFLYLYRAPIHFENHKFKFRARIAPMGVSKSQQILGTLKNYAEVDMKIIHEEENESKLSSKFNSAKKQPESMSQTLKDVQQQLDFDDCEIRDPKFFNSQISDSFAFGSGLKQKHSQFNLS